MQLTKYRAPVTPSSTYPTGRSFTRLSTPAALALVTLSYLLAGVVAAITVVLWKHHHPIAVALLADIAATVTIFALSMVFANSSLYDAYWSVIPPVVAIGWAIASPSGLSTGAHIRQVVVIVLVLAWSVRLTQNWTLTWSGFDHEDWRYVGIREGLPRGVPWPVISLVGIQIMPTLVVFVGMLPLWPAVGVGRNGFGVLDVVGIIVTAGAIFLETVSDAQLRAFSREPANHGKPMDRGLWSLSRHPNYLGEIGFWAGLYAFALAADPSWWWTLVGPVVMIALFEAASIPLMEKRSIERRPEYTDYQARVAKLLPLRPPSTRSARISQRQA